MHASSWLSQPSFPARSGRLGAALIGCLLIAACSGDGSTGGTDPGAPQANRCAPDNSDARNAQGALLSNYRDGSRSLEKQWLAAYFEQNYLWPSEIPDVNPNEAVYNTGTHFALMTAYFDALRSKEKQADGLAKDRHSFTYRTADYNLLSGGVALGYGVEWLWSTETPRQIWVGAIQPGSQAEQVGLARGDRLLTVTVDGVTVAADSPTTAGIAALIAVLFPKVRNQTITLALRAATGQAKTVTVTTGEVTTQPVLVSRVVDVGSRRVGYMNLMDFNTPAEAQMVTVFQQFSSSRVQDLVIDLRYNGGGYIYLSSQLAFMVAGPVATRNRVFERLQYNEKRASDNVDTPFYGVTTGYAGSNTVRGTSLPTLNLNRVTVLTTASTCSASEALINGLRGIGVTVDVVGARTCGKPYGFTQKDNCGISYFPIEFQGLNAKGEGDYASGMAPSCQANDDLSKPLGDVGEGMLAAALAYRNSGVCPALKSTGREDGGAARRVRLPFQEGMFLHREERQ